MMDRGQRSCLVVIWLIMLGATGFFLLLAIGSQRYGGLDGLYRRVRAEALTRFGQVRPHSEFVPTPLPQATINVNAFASQLNALPPTNTPIPSPTATLIADGSSSTVAPAAPAPIYQPAQAFVELTGFQHMWQTWNNCGPATLATNLSFFHVYLKQSEVASVLKPNPDDKNVNPEEMVVYVQAQGLQARVFVNGNDERLKLLLSNGIPVLLETWLEPKPGDGLGHYRLLIGYDDAAQTWFFSDSYVGTGLRSGEGEAYRGITVPYAKMDRLWHVFNRTYVVVYPDHLSSVVQAIIGPDMSQQTMWINTLIRFQAEIQTNPDDPFAWFNLGTTLATMGQFSQATVAYDQARTLGLPWRMLWYQFKPFQAYYETGRHDELITLAEATIEAGGEIEEIYYWKGRALAAKNDLANAQKAWESALAINPSYEAAAVAMAESGGR